VSKQGLDYTPIEFRSEGATLRGRLYLPVDAPRPVPAVVMAHGLSATIPMVLDKYAEAISTAGFAAVAYDHRNLGTSGGEPRKEINPWVHARGYRDALTFAAGVDDIDAERLALWGDSNSSAVALAVASVDPRVKLVLTQVPALGAAEPPEDPEDKRFLQIKDSLLNADVTGTTVAGPMPVVSYHPGRDGSVFQVLTATRWFLEYGSRFGSGWFNDVTRAVPDVPEPWNPGLCAGHVTVPVLMVVSPGDEIPSANPRVARAVFDALTGAKRWVDVAGGHFGIVWHPSEEFDITSRAQVDFLRAHL